MGRQPWYDWTIVYSARRTGTSRRGRPSRASWLVLALFLAAASDASAQAADVAAARDAYDRGAASYDAGEYAVAATQLSRADALVPNDVALELALKAAVKANDAVLVMELAARADGRRSRTLHAVRDDARSRMSARVGRVTVACAPGTRCTATFDDTPFPVGEARWVLTGDHRVVIDSGDGNRQAFPVRVDPGVTVPVTAASTPAHVPIPPPSDARRTSIEQAPHVVAPPRSGVSPVWFWVGAGLSAVLGGVTIASAVDTRSKYDEFSVRPSSALSNDGAEAQLRTNLLFAGTAASAVTTAVLGLFFVRWGAPSERAAASSARSR